MNLTGLREAAAAALAAIDEVAAGDWVVLAESTDAVQPPCFVLEWGPDPSRTPASFCSDNAQLEVIAVGGRLTPEGAVLTVESMWDAAVAALCDANLRPYESLGPGPHEVGKVAYLAVRIHLRQPVDIARSP